MNNREWDDFEDVRSGEAGVSEGGILDSAGLRDYDGIQTAVVKDGAGSTLNCRFCNKKRRVDVEWGELVVLAENVPNQPPVLPPNWQYSQANATAYTTLQCPSCGKPGFSIHMTPQEAQSHVRAGLSANLVNPQFVNQIQQSVRMRRGY